MLWHIELKFCTWLWFNVLRIKFECLHFAPTFKELCLFVNSEYRKCAVFRTFLLHALTYWAEILHLIFVLMYYSSSSSVVILRQFLVHLSRRLKCTIVITRCPSSVCLSVCPSVRRPSLTFHIFDFSSETAEQNSTKRDREQERNVLYQVCVFRADQKNKMAALASDWLRHFRLFLWNRWTKFNKTWQEARSQCPLQSLCFWGRSEKQDGCPGLWLAETFSTSTLKPLNVIQQNLIKSKISMSSTKFVFFLPISKIRWPPLMADGRPILSVVTLFQFLQDLCLFMNLEYKKCEVFRTFHLHALRYWAEIVH